MTTEDELMACLRKFSDAEIAAKQKDDEYKSLEKRRELIVKELHSCQEQIERCRDEFRILLLDGIEGLPGLKANSNRYKAL